jgi:hypothetical protein
MLQTIEVDNGGRWYRITDLQKKFSLGRSKAWELVRQMERNPDFPRSVIHAGSRVTLVDGESFERYLWTMNENYWERQREQEAL